MLTKAKIARVLAAAFLVTAALPLTASAGDLFDQTGSSCCCPVCDHVCKLKAEETETERTKFESETKTICIPRVVFPWQKAKKQACASCDSCDGRGCTTCVHNGARVRKVCVAKPKKYTCPACKYTWSAEKKDCSSCTDCCDNGAACDGSCFDHVAPQLAAPQIPHPVPTAQVPAAQVPAGRQPTIQANPGNLYLDQPTRLTNRAYRTPAPAPAPAAAPAPTRGSSQSVPTVADQGPSLFQPVRVQPLKPQNVK